LSSAPPRLLHNNVIELQRRCTGKAACPNCSTFHKRQQMVGIEELWSLVNVSSTLRARVSLPHFHPQPTFSSNHGGDSNRSSMVGHTAIFILKHNPYQGCKSPPRRKDVPDDPRYVMHAYLVLLFSLFMVRLFLKTNLDVAPGEPCLNLRPQRYEYTS